MSRTKRTVVRLILFAWVCCGIFNYGATLAYLQSKYPNIADVDYKYDVAWSIYMGVLGPFGTVSELINFNPREFGWRSK